MIHRIDTPGDHQLQIIGGEVAARDCVVEITAPDVTLRIDGSGMTRREGDPQGDHDWPAFVRVAASAVRCRIVDSQLVDIAGIAVDVYADDFEMLGTLATRFAAGVKLDGCRRALIQDSALHTADKMLRLTEGGNDDTGANPIMVYNTPYDDQPTMIRRCYLGNARAHSHDYGEDGASFEVWQSQSVTLEDCILLDSGTGLETGSKGTQVGNLIFRRCYIGNTQPADGERLVRGLMFRPVVDSLVEDCKFFDLDHWDVVVNQGSSSYAAGETENFRFTGNDHACTRNSQPYAVQPGPAPIIEEDLALFGDEAAPLAAQLRGEAIQARDAILAGAGLKTGDPGPVPSDLEARVAALEAGLAAEAEARADGDDLLIAELAALDARLDAIADAAD